MLLEAKREFQTKKLQGAARAKQKQLDKQTAAKKAAAEKAANDAAIRRSEWRKPRKGCTIIRNRKRCNKCNKFWFRWSWF
jgi:hypothetical protein